MTARGAWVGLDVGTTSSKAVAYDETGAPIGTGRARTIWRTTDHGVETDADALLQQALTALDEAVRQLPDGTRVLGVGVTSMGETGVLVDRAGRPCGPSIAWHDARDDVEVEALRRDLGEEAFGARAGKPLRGQFSLTKHRWLRQHQAGAAEAVRRFNVAEWVVRGLSGAEVCDRSLAGRTGWFDLAAGDWWDEALSWSGATRELMPALVDAGEAVGRVRSGHPQLHGAVVTDRRPRPPGCRRRRRCGRDRRRARLLRHRRGAGAHGASGPDAGPGPGPRAGRHHHRRLGAARAVVVARRDRGRAGDGAHPGAPRCGARRAGGAGPRRARPARRPLRPRCRGRRGRRERCRQCRRRRRGGPGTHLAVDRRGGDRSRPWPCTTR